MRMNNTFCKETENIYRLKVPFDNIYTSVFLIESGEKRFLIDCATTAEDVDGCIVPALEEFGCALTNIDSLVISHKHHDHAGGLTRVLVIAPDIKVVTDVRELCDGISTYSLAGHTTDCIGVFDGRTGTLITADGLQGAGVDKYRCNINDKAAYLKTIEKIKMDEKIKHILFSHAYEPWNQDFISGRKNICECLKACIEYVEEV